MAGGNARSHAVRGAALRVSRWLPSWTHNYPRNDDKKWFAKLQTPQLNYISKSATTQGAPVPGECGKALWTKC